jgi:hypothetical protein
MKRLVLFLGITITASAITWVLNAQTKPKEPPKTYHVNLTIDQWQSIFNGLESIKNAVKTSNMSAAQSTFISDSLISTYQNEFLRQIQGQLAAEQKPQQQVKKDTTKPKK